MAPVQVGSAADDRGVERCEQDAEAVVFALIISEGRASVFVVQQGCNEMEVRAEHKRHKSQNVDVLIVRAAHHR